MWSERAKVWGTPLVGIGGEVGGNRVVVGMASEGWCRLEGAGWDRRQPVAVFKGIAHRTGAVFLDSALNRGRGEVSLIACEPEWIWRSRRHGWGELAGWLRANEVRSASPLPGAPAGAAIGFMTYEGEAVFACYPRLLAFNHARGTWWDHGGAKAWFGEHRAVTNVVKPGMAQVPVPALRFVPETGRGAYVDLVKQAQERIAAGDIYQVNLARRFASPWPAGASAFGVYEALREVSPAPHAAFLYLDGRQILSASPELFLRMEGGRVWTRPVKGTRPRFSDAAADERSARELMASAKERAELTMITDLERNDLGRICQFGSVRVTGMLELERFAQVFHLVSTVEGRLRAEIDHVEALRACSPGGSITGAPKLKAMEIIRELEPVPRGPYTGAIGYLGCNGVSQFSIAIRTAVVEGNSFRFHSGAGIVADSDPDAEFEETEHKAAGLLALQGKGHETGVAAALDWMSVG